MRSWAIIGSGLFIIMLVAVGSGVNSGRNPPYYGNTRFCKGSHFAFIDNDLTMGIYRVLDQARIQNRTHSSPVSLDVDCFICYNHPIYRHSTRHWGENSVGI